MDKIQLDMILEISRIYAGDLLDRLDTTQAQSKQEQWVCLTAIIVSLRLARWIRDEDLETFCAFMYKHLKGHQYEMALVDAAAKAGFAFLRKED